MFRGILKSGVALRLPPQSKSVILNFVLARRISWPHAPEHRLSVRERYFYLDCAGRAPAATALLEWLDVMDVPGYP